MDQSLSQSITKTRIRKNFLPKSTRDSAFTVFSLIIIPTIYWFEIFVVLPHVYKDTDTTFWPIFHTGMGTFIAINISGNLLALILYDTSISGMILTPKSDWKLCSVCETYVPPRSWHCSLCDVCVLKRDHHCSFCSNCIGYFNQRYFIHFLFYVFIATAYATLYNFFFIYELNEFKSWMMILNVIFPMVMLLFDSSLKQLYMFLSLLVMVLCVYSGAMLIYHFKLLLRGAVVFERNSGGLYDLGKLENIKEVFGDRWKICWISPFIKSNLRGDGQHFRAGRKLQ